VIPRYTPAIRLRPTPRRSAKDAARFFHELVPTPSVRHFTVTGSARQALLLHYRRLREKRGGEVLLPAQICPVVPEVVRSAGLCPIHLDGDGRLATPGPAQYLEAMRRPEVAGLLVAPMSGYFQSGWDTLLAEVPSTLDLTLDLAQAPLSAAAFGAAMIERANAIVFSFGEGKGFDTGGALLATKDANDFTTAELSPVPILVGATIRSAAFRLAVGAGLYRALLPLVDHAAGSDIRVEEPRLVRPSIVRWWAGSLETLRDEFGQAIRRGREIDALPAVQAASWRNGLLSDPSQPLRHLLRLRSDLDRDGVVRDLRAHGLDCAPAGEPFPAHGDPHSWPEALAFTRETIRLPFLGRLSERAYTHVKAILTTVISAHAGGAHSLVRSS